MARANKAFRYPLPRRRLLVAAAMSAGSAVFLAACGGTGTAVSTGVAASATASLAASTAAGSTTNTSQSLLSSAAAQAASSASPASSSSAQTTASTSAVGSTAAPASAVSSRTAAPAGAATTAPAGTATKLTMLWPTYTQEKTDWGKSIVDGYAKAQPGTTIDGIFTGAPNTTDPYTKLTAMVAAGAPPDTVWLGSGWVAFADQNVIRPLDDLVSQSKLNLQQYYSGILGALKWQNKLFCLPLGGQTCVIAINEQLVQAAGATMPTDDWTFPDAIALAQKLTKADQGQYGISLDWGYWSEWIMAYGGDGGTVNDQWQTPDWSIPARQDMLTLWHDLWAKDQVDASPDYKTQQYKSDDLKFFESGKLGMVAGYSWLVPDFRPTVKSFTWDIRMIPYTVSSTGEKVRHSALYTDEMALASGGKQIEAAFAFLRWVCGPDQLTAAAKGGHITPAIQSIAESDAFLGSTLPPKNIKAYLSAFNGAIGLGLHPAWSQFSGPVGKAIGAAKAGTTDVKTALAQCDDLTAKALAAYAAQHGKS